MTELQARTFAVWTALSGVVRLYAAYNIKLKMSVPGSHLTRVHTDAMYFTTDRIYDLTLFTYLFAFAHFGSELLIFRTASFGPGALSPVVVSSESILIGSATRSPDPSGRVIACSRVLDLDDRSIRLLRAVRPPLWEPASASG